MSVSDDVTPNNQLYTTFAFYDSDNKFAGYLVRPRYSNSVATRTLTKLDTDGLKATDDSRPPHLDSKSHGSHYK